MGTLYHLQRNECSVKEFCEWVNFFVTMVSEPCNKCNVLVRTSWRTCSYKGGVPNSPCC